MRTFQLTALSAAFCVALSTGALGANMTRDDYKAAKNDITAKYKSDKAACKGMSGNAKDNCI